MNVVTVVVSITLFFSLSVSTNAQTFLQKVDETTAARVTNYNMRFLSERLYFSKRHRIVEVDYKRLREKNLSAISLFDGDPMLALRRDEMRRGQIHGAATWIGRIDLPEFKIDETQIHADEARKIENTGLTVPQILNQIGKVELFMMYWDVNEKTREAFPSAERRSQGFGAVPTEGATNDSVEKSAFATISGNIDLSFVGRGVYRIEPLKYSPRYHVIYEVDTSKSFGVVEAAIGSDNTVSTEGQKKLDFEEFQRGLPPEIKQLVTGDLL